MDTASYYNRCRLCCAEARLSLQLFEAESIRLDLVNKIRSYLSISVSMHDGLPQKICYECLSRIELFHSYKQSCLESQHTLKHWNLFCDGGSVPQDVDVFSGRSESPDMLVDAHKSNAAVFPKRASAQNMVQQRVKSNEVILSRKQSLLSSPVVNKKYAATPPKTKTMNSVRLEQTMEVSPENKKKSLAERTSQDNCAARRQQSDSASLDPPSYLQVTVKELNRSSNDDSGTKSLTQVPGKFSQVSTVEKDSDETMSTLSRSPTPYSRRTRTSVKAVKSTCPEKMLQLLNQSPKTRSGPETRKQAPGKFQDVEKSNLEKDIRPISQGRSPSPYPVTRSQTPVKNIKSSPPEKTMPLMQKQLASPKCPVSETGMISRSRSLDRSANSEKVATKSSPISPKIQIISIESLAAMPNTKLPVHSPENDSWKAKIRNSSVASTSDKDKESDSSTRSQMLNTVEKPFAPTISEMVKQRKRSNSVASQSFAFVRKPRKPRTRTSPAGSSGSAGINKENSDSNLSAWLANNEDENLIATQDDRNVVDENNPASVQGIDDSTQALLRLLESDDDDDDDDDIDFYQSEAENFENDDSRPETPNSRDPKNAYVKVEKLPGDSKLRIRTEEELNAGIPVRRLRRPRQQSNQYRLVKVVKDEVTGRERYKCLKCGSLLSNKCYIKEHMKIHTGDKDFKCEKCGKAFRNNYMLKAHDAVHLRERNYTCNECGSTFVQRDRLRQHIRVHALEQLECTECGHKTNQKQAMKRHMRIHTGERPYECEFCGGRYSDRSTWINHRRIHTGERPFSCPLCGKTFSRIVHLQAHKRSHSNERPFPCHLCPSRSKTKAHLVKHLTSMHTDIMKSVVNFIKEEQSEG